MKRFILFLTMAVFSVIAISSCTCMKEVRPKPPEPRDKPVLIITSVHGHKLDVKPWIEHLNYRRDEQIIWQIDDPDREFNIYFNKNGSPFEKNHFKNADNESGNAQVDPGSNVLFYDYTVEVDGFDSLDPVIIIHR